VPKSRAKIVNPISEDAIIPKRGRPRKKSNSSSTNQVSSLVNVLQLRQKKVVLVPTSIEGSTLYLRPPSIKFSESLHEATSNNALGSMIATYLGEHLFNDAEGLKPVGTVDEFKENFSSVEMLELFTRLNDGLLSKKKVN
jgi:hypothetical protein